MTLKWLISTGKSHGVYEKKCFVNSEIQRNMSLEKSYCDKVPQWVVLGPLLFIYINDIFLEIQSTIGQL